jgi:hypothetical protein
VTRFRIEAIRIETTREPVEYEFTADLTVLAGKTGVGKSTLFELIKHSLGGDAMLSSVVRDSVRDVHLTIRIENRRLQFARAISEARSKTVRVTDLSQGSRLPDHFINREPKISDLLLTELGIPVDVPAAAKNSTKPGARITFNDVFRFMYIAQDVINQAIAGSGDSYYEPKRKATFELMFGVTNAELLKARSRVNTLKSEIAQAQQRATIAREALEQSGVASRFDAQIKLDEQVAHESEADQVVTLLKNELDLLMDSRAQMLRALLVEAERDVTEVSAAEAAAQESLLGLDQERQRLAQSRARLARIAVADETIGLFEFTTCPRCTQSLAERPVPNGACPVCLQQDPKEPRNRQPVDAEIHRLEDQLESLDDQVTALREGAVALSHALNKKKGLAAGLSQELDERTRKQITPRLENYADAVGQARAARARQEHFESVLRQWDHQEDLVLKAEALEREQETLATRLTDLEDDRDHKRQLLVDDLSEVFAVVVDHFRIPGVKTAGVDSNTYLPVLNGMKYTEYSKAGGGIVTLTQIAYWLAVNTVATERSRGWRDVHYPTLLLIDTPRLALNDQPDSADRIYTRFQTQAATFGGGAQIILADNALPPNLDTRFKEIEFTYERPTISSVPHPGEGRVEVLHAPADATEPVGGRRRTKRASTP